MLCKPRLYFGVCLVVRALFAYLVSKQPMLGTLAWIPAIGFAWIFLLGLRRGSVTETGPGCRVWWNALRPLHAVLYLLTALLATSKTRSKAYVPLAYDALIGVIAGVSKA